MGPEAFVLLWSNIHLCHTLTPSHDPTEVYGSLTRLTIHWPIDPVQGEVSSCAHRVAAETLTHYMLLS